MMPIALLALLPALAAAQAPLDPAACKALPLTHAEEDERDRAGRALYFNCGSEVLQDAAMAAKLVEHVHKGTTSAGSVVLLGYLPQRVAEKELARLMKSSQRMKLNSWTGVVPANVPATVALARLNDATAGRRLAALSQEQSLNTREFLLDVMRDFPEMYLRLLLPYLEDNREISSGVPSGAAPRRRLADAALSAFAQQLKLKLTFEVNDARRYTDPERAAARNAIDSALH